MKKVFQLREIVFAGFIAVASLTAASPAIASGCGGASEYTSVSFGSSDAFGASAGCNGVWARLAQREDYVRGRFYKDGSWQTSTYGYVFVSSSRAANNQLIGNTAAGRACKGQGQAFSQHVIYAF